MDVLLYTWEVMICSRLSRSSLAIHVHIFWCSRYVEFADYRPRTSLIFCVY